MKFSLALCHFPNMAFPFVNFGNKLTCDPGWKRQLNSHWLEKIHRGVLGEVEQGTGSALCMGCDFLYLFCRDWQHLDVADSTVSRAVRLQIPPLLTQSLQHPAGKCCSCCRAHWEIKHSELQLKSGNLSGWDGLKVLQEHLAALQNNSF